MKYEARQGIVKLSLCGVSFLTPIRKESKNCTPVFVLNIFSTIIWQALSEVKTAEQICDMFKKMNMPENKAREIVGNYLKAFVEKGYVIEVE